MKKIVTIILTAFMLFSYSCAFAATIDVIDTDLSTGDVYIKISGKSFGVYEK